MRENTAPLAFFFVSSVAPCRLSPAVDCSLTVGARCRCPPNQTLNGAGEATDEKELRFAQPDPFSPQERSPTDPDVYVAATGPLRSGS